MPSISLCPACKREITIPSDLARDRRLRCPLCNAPFLAEAGGGYLFSPRRSVAAFRAKQRAARRSRVQPSQADRGKPGLKARAPGERYDRHAYIHANTQTYAAPHAFAYSRASVQPDAC